MLNSFKYQKKSPIKIQYEKEGKGLWEPANWREFLTNLRDMRSNMEAPVDTMGCDKSPDTEASPEVFRYQSLISLMLSSQTKDQVTFAAMGRLRARGLTVDNVLAITEEELGELIKPVGFWKTKAKYIKKTTQILKDQYNSDIPDTAEKMCKLIGVGPKMAHICMKVAWNKVSGIGVDTHVHRISNRIGWVKKPTTTPEDTRKALESWLPFELWSEVNNLMVGFGQTICAPISPSCNECLNRHICPYTGKVRKSPNPKTTPSKLETNIDVIKINEIQQPRFSSEQSSLNTIETIEETVEPIEDRKPSTEATTAKSLNVKNELEAKTKPLKKKTQVKEEPIEAETFKPGFNTEEQIIKKEIEPPLHRSPNKRKKTVKYKDDSDSEPKVRVTRSKGKILNK